jgi:hypothetical protein
MEHDVAVLTLGVKAEIKVVKVANRRQRTVSKFREIMIFNSVIQLSGIGYSVYSVATSKGWNKRTTIELLLFQWIIDICLTVMNQIQMSKG